MACPGWAVMAAVVAVDVLHVRMRGQLLVSAYSTTGVKMMLPVESR
jgi:hypothetical protein